MAKHPSPARKDAGTDFTHISIPTPTLSEEELNAAPWAVADLFVKTSSWEAIQSDVLPKARTDVGVLTSGREHYIEVALDLPESQVNLDAGLFGVFVELQSSNGTKLAVSMRSSRMPYQSSFISTIKKSVLLVPFLIGALHETKTIVVPSFRHLVESSSLPLVR